MTTSQERIGGSMRRREDERLLRGQGRYASDIQPANALHVAFVRSTMATADIVECDVDDARQSAGVEAVFTGSDVRDIGDLSVSDLMTIEGELSYPVLADQTVAAVGQPIAAVLATDARLAVDAAECVFVDLEERETAPGTPARVTEEWTSGDVKKAFARAEHIVKARVQHPRLAPTPLEPRAITVEYDRDSDAVTVWLATQTPHRARLELAKMLCVCETRIQVVAIDVGGAFGMKAALNPEDVLVVWAAFKLRQSVKWVASRSEDFLSATHGRGGYSEGELALSKAGKILAVRARMQLPLGHWLPTSAVIPAWNAGRLIPTAYAVSDVHSTALAVQTDTAAVGIYRGAGRPEANCLMERLMDEAAYVTGADPAEFRLTHFIRPEQFPYTLPSGYTLDNGDYGRALRSLLDACDYAQLKRRRDQRRADGELVGIGLGFYVEPCGVGWESARVTLQPDGTVVAATGGSSQGHGRETAIAQIVATTLDIDIARVDVKHSDTRTCPIGIGALASRSTAIGGSAMVEACTALKERLHNGALPAEPVTEEINYTNDGEAWGYGCYLINVCICRNTGKVAVEAAYCIDDVGTVVNPLLVEGQIMGGFAQGLGEALLEAVIYDENNQLLTGSLTDYAVPRADDIPNLKILKQSLPSPNNTLGAKGVGEAGTIGTPAAILNAAIDALRPIGVTQLDMPLTSHKVWRAIQQADSTSST